MIFFVSSFSDILKIFQNTNNLCHYQTKPQQNHNKTTTKPKQNHNKTTTKIGIFQQYVQM